MKLNSKYIMRTILDEVLLLPTEDVILNFNGMISANEVAGFILKNLEKAETDEDMIQLVLDHFEIDKATATSDVKEFLNNIRAIQMIED